MALADDAQILRGEKDARLVRVVCQEGLNPYQVIREWDPPKRGLDTGEATKLLERLNRRANADNKTPGSPVTAARYVVDPQVGKHVFDGLWTVGPVTMEKPEDRDRRWVCRQVLTRTWCAGHGYEAIGHDAIVSTSTASDEFATVRQALASHRSEVKRIFSSRMAFRSDIPGSYRTEVRWRDYTHESRPFIECESGREAVAQAVADVYGDDFGQIEEVHCEIDKDTDTVVIVAAAIFKFLEEPETIDDLLDAPKVEGPCERETLRPLGWNELADGEGYKYTHSWKWYDLKDTPAVRRLLEFRIFDKDVLPRLLEADYLADGPQLVQGAADADNGRFKFPDGRAWWRVVDQKPESADDGTLTFTLTAIRADWFGSAGKRVEAAVENPEGAGRSKRVVTPSLDREKAAAVAAAATADEGHILGSVTREQAADGGEDVVVRQLKVWTWQNGDVPAGAAALEGIVASDARKTTTATKTAWEITFDRVKKDEAENLLQAIGDRLTQSGAQGRVTVKDVQNTDEGVVRLVLRAEGVEQKHFSEWLRTGTFFETVHRALSFNIPESQLEPGGLEEATGDIYTSDRQVNDDGTWDETRDRVAVSEPRHLRFKTKTRPHGRAVDVDVFRNETELPDGLRDGGVAGSASYNDHGRIDGETRDIDQEDDKRRTASEDHFSRTESETDTDATDRIPDAGLDPATGKLTSVQQQENGDGTFSHTVNEEVPKPCEVSFQTKSGDGHHPRLVSHRVVRNADEIPAELANLTATGTDRVAGSAQHNRFGKVDGEIQTWDAAADDDKGRTAAEDHFSRTVGSSEVGSASRAGEAGVANGTITTVRETEFPDGAIRSEVSKETAKPCEVSFQTKAGDGHHPRLVSHRIVRNADEIPAELANLSATGTDRVAGSAQHNRFGKVDGEIQTWDAASDDDRAATKEEDRFHVETGETGVGADAPTPAEYADGTIASREIVTFPDGAQRVRAVADRAKPARWSQSYTVHRGDLTGQVLVIAWRNQPAMESPAPPDDDMTLDVNQVQNRYGYWDGTATYSPNWDRIRDGRYASDIEEVRWDQDVTETRRARNYQNQIVDQTRLVRYSHYVKAGNMTWTAAVAHLQGSCMPFEPPVLQTFRMNVGYVRGYYADRVTMTVLQDWNPQ